MGSACCGGSDTPHSSTTKFMTEDELEERRKLQAYNYYAEAAEKRSKDFKQGGGGEKLKAKAKQLEEAERKNREAGGSNSLKWSVS